MSDMSDWLTKAQAAQFLGVGEKTVERLANAGKLQRSVRDRMTVFHPADLERERGARQAPVEAFEVPPENDVRHVEPVRHSEQNGAVVRHVRPVPNLDPRVVVIQPAISPVFLTTKQAMEYSGLSEDFLLKLVRAGNLRRVAGMRGFRYKRADLDKLELS